MIPGKGLALSEASPCDCAACALCSPKGCAEYLSVAALDSLPANIKVGLEKGALFWARSNVLVYVLHLCHEEGWEQYFWNIPVSEKCLERSHKKSQLAFSRFGMRLKGALLLSACLFYQMYLLHLSM